MFITSNIEEFMKDFDDLEKKQIPYMQMVTTNNIAFDYMETMRKKIADDLNIRNKKITTSLRVKKATKLRPFAEVFVDEFSWQHKVLSHHFHGGNRERKGLEKAMIHKGFMYKWEILTPSPGVTIKPGVYNQMMAQLKLNYKAGYSANETKQSRKRKSPSKTIARFFIITGKSKSPLAPGIYARMPLHDKPICMLRIAEKPSYKKRFDLEDTLNEVYNLRGDAHFAKAYELAMRTAR